MIMKNRNERSSYIVRMLIFFVISTPLIVNNIVDIGKQKGYHGDNYCIK